MECCHGKSSNRQSAQDRSREDGICKTFYRECLPLSMYFGERLIELPQVSKTIEKRILQIQKRKLAIVNEAFRGSGKADPESIQNLKIMFGDD